MRAAVGEAISTSPASRLPGLLFGGAPGAEPAPTDELPTLYWLLVPSPHGYSVAEHRSAGRIGRGSVIALAGIEYRVAVVAASPFLDGRPCAYLEPAS